MFSFITLEATGATGSSGSLMPILMIVLLVVVFYFMYRSQKKQERQANEMRNNLEVGDEITTIGGIVGEIVSIKEETVTIETTKNGTKIKFLRTAIRNVDVSAAQKRGDIPMSDAPKAEKASAIEKAERVDNKETDVEQPAEKAENIEE